MNAAQALHHSEVDTQSAAIAGGHGFAGLGAIATIALSIVGLTGALSLLMASISAIVIGVAAMIEGGALKPNGIGLPSFAWSRGFGRLEVQGGFTALVLGILALMGVAPVTLLAVAVLALGATFLLSGRLLTGLASVVLGILALVSLFPLTLILVGLLVSGAGLLWSGTENAISMLAATES